MSGSTDRLGLYLAGGGSSEEFDDETIDIDKQNGNFEDIDEAIGAPGFTSTTRPATPFDGQLIWETDTERLKRWSTSVSQWLTVVDTLSGAEISGAMKLWPAAAAPDGYLICDGSAISRTTYAALFTVLGTTYGTGDGSSTFNLPNLKGRVPVGLDSSQTEFDALAETGGANTHTLTIAQMPSHTHNLEWASPAPTPTITSDNGWKSPRPSSGFLDNSAIKAAGSGNAHNNLQPYLVLNYIIKT